MASLYVFESDDWNGGGVRVDSKIELEFIVRFVDFV